MCGPVRVLAGWTGPFPFWLNQFSVFWPTDAESVDAFLAFVLSYNISSLQSRSAIALSDVVATVSPMALMTS